MNIAEKLTTIAENQQKVYDAGFNDGKAQGGDPEVAYKEGEDNAFALVESELSDGYTNYDYFFYYHPSEYIDTKLLRHTSSGTSFRYMFHGCNKLKEAPAFDTTSATNFSNMFYNCTSLTKLPTFDYSNISTVTNMFYYCSSLTTVSDLDLSTCTEGGSVFYQCTGLTAVSNIKTPKKASYMFYKCSGLTKAVDIGASNCDDISYMFNGCTSLKEVLNLTLAKNSSRVFYGCSSLEKVLISGGAPSGTNGQYMFYECANLHTIEGLDLSQLTSYSNTFSYCSALENLTLEGKINYTGLNLLSCSKLTHDSLMSVINALADKSSASGTFKITLGATNLAKLTEEEKAIMDSKGWTYA